MTTLSVLVSNRTVDGNKQTTKYSVIFTHKSNSIITQRHLESENLIENPNYIVKLLHAFITQAISLRLKKWTNLSSKPEFLVLYLIVFIELRPK